MAEKLTANPAAAALIADSAIFKASGKLEKALQPFRHFYGKMSGDEIAQIMKGAKVVYKPQER